MIVSFFFLSLSAWSRRWAAFSKSWSATASSFSWLSCSISLVDLLQVRRPGHALEPDAGAGLVDHVDRLVRQAAAGDVAVGQLDGRLERVVGDLHAVVRLVAVAQAA